MQASPVPTCFSCSRRSKFVKRYSSRCDRTATLPVSRKRNFLGRYPAALPKGRYLRRAGRALIGYDAAKNYELVHTLSHYLECCGSYDGSAATLHVHRSTLRYRLGRIADLRSFDLRNIETRFNLHAATRVWRFLTPDP